MPPRDTEFNYADKAAGRSAQRARPNARNVWTLRMLAAQTEWLTGSLRWEDGRVVWVHPRGTLAPTTADLAAAQRSLHQVARYPDAGGRAFGNGGEWLAERQARLEEAKVLYLLRAPDLSTLAKAGTPDAVADLVALLQAEAVCLNGLPESPAHSLVRAGAFARADIVSQLQDLLARDSVPPAGRALASLVLGALAGSRAPENGEGAARCGSAAELAWQARAFRWGAQRGLPAEPGLAVAFLNSEDGTELLARWPEATGPAHGFTPPAEVLRAMLAKGQSPQQVLELCDHLTQLERLGPHITRGVLEQMETFALRSGLGGPKLAAWRTQVRERMEKLQAALAQIARETALTTGDSEAARLTWMFVSNTMEKRFAFAEYVGDEVSLVSPQARRRRQRQLERNLQSGPGFEQPLRRQPDVNVTIRVTELLWDFVLRNLRSAQMLSPDLRVPYLQMIVDESNRLWGPDGYEWQRVNESSAQRADYMEAMLLLRWQSGGEALALLLKRSGDVQICQAALDLGLHEVLAKYRFRDAGLYAYALQLHELMDAGRQSWRARYLLRRLEKFATQEEARASLGPAVDALAVLAPDARAEAFRDLMYNVGRTRYALRSQLPRLAPSLKVWAQLTEQTGQKDDFWCSLAALVALEAVSQKRRRNAAPVGNSVESSVEASQPDHAEPDGDASPLALTEWITFLHQEVNLVLEERKAADADYWSGVALVTRICAQLADGDLARFKSSFPLIARREIENATGIERGLDALHRYPGLQALLTEQVAVVPARVLRLLARLGVTSHLGTEALGTLQPWRQAPQSDDAPQSDEAAPDDDANLPPDWREAHSVFPPDLVPLWEALARGYLWSQGLQGGATAIPIGVRRALAQPDTLAKELAHLDALSASQPHRADLAQRVTMLRSRLENPAQLQREAATEACDRLRHAAAKSRLGAAEASVENCFREQLQTLIGRVPRELAMNDDWLNATLLLVDISENRKLLRNLLRALASGDTGWVDALPGNQLFLRGIAQRGINAEAWMGEHRKRYLHPDLPGGRVHLRVESDPLQVLQMGNAFGTCLSVGDINSFSTVANACEANKRVIFARDSQGRIVARKLIAISGECALVGFHSYVSGPNDAANTALSTTLSRYARDFAACCNLPLADSGTVPVLFAEEWYDDGCVAWSEVEGKWMDGKPSLAVAD